MNSGMYSSLRAHAGYLVPFLAGPARRLGRIRPRLAWDVQAHLVAAGVVGRYSPEPGQAAARPNLGGEGTSRRGGDALAGATRAPLELLTCLLPRSGGLTRPCVGLVITLGDIIN